jgi:hypothetical protein
MASNPKKIKLSGGTSSPAARDALIKLIASLKPVSVPRSLRP